MKSKTQDKEELVNMLASLKPGEVVFVKNSKGYVVYPAGEPKLSEQIGETTIHYRLATLHLQGLDAYELLSDKHGVTVIAHRAPKPDRPLVAFKAVRAILCATQFELDMTELEGVVPFEGPEFGDGHDYEGFAGGCERMGCKGICVRPEPEEIDPLADLC